MSIDYIVSASPTVVEKGVNDLSTRQVLPEPIPIPQHCPKFYLYAKKGPTTPQLVVGPSRSLRYGVDTFDTDSAYFNHATLFSNLVNAEGNSVMMERVVPTDAGPEANFTLWLDIVAEPEVAIYNRGADGSVLSPATTSNDFAGYSFKWVKETYSNASAMTAGFGLENTKTGTITASDSTVSTMYPIMSFRANSQGKFGNDTAIRLRPAPAGTFPNSITNVEKVFPFQLTVTNRDNPTSSATVVNSKYGEDKIMFSFKKNSRNPNTTGDMDLGVIFPSSYENPDDTKFPLSFSDFDDIHVYYENVTTVTGLMHAAESAYLTAFDAESGSGSLNTATPNWTANVGFTSSQDDIYLVNLLTGRTLSGVPYVTLENDISSPVQALSPLTNIYMESGSDGTMNNTLFDTLVSSKLNEYTDPDSMVQDNAVNVESVFYDSGFGLETKKLISGFISQRKDTYVVLSTHIAGALPLTVSGEQSTAEALWASMVLHPESSFFGTGVFRGIIVGQSGVLRNSRWTDRVPMSAEIAIKASRYMGAGSGKWKNGFSFDSAPGSLIDNLTNVEPGFIPATAKYLLWDTHVIWVQPFDRRSSFFPALQTSYKDETSVLNGYFTMAAMAELNKVGWKAWRRFTGNQSLSNAQLAERVEEYVNEQVRNRFDDKFVIVPDVFFTANDTLRGYSYSLTIKVYAPNMKTVQTLIPEAYRIEDLGV